MHTTITGRRRSLFALLSFFTTATLLVLTAGVPSAAPPAATPFDEGEGKTAFQPPAGGGPAEPELVGPFTEPDDAFPPLADRVADLQADITEDNATNGDPDADLEDGGWDWTLPPAAPGHSGGASFSNLYGPIAKGLAYAHRHTGSARYLTSVLDAWNGRAATFPTRRGQNALFEAMVLLSENTGDPAHASAAKALWNDFLTFGNGGAWPGGTAEGWATFLHTARAGQGIPEIAPWDVWLYVESALALDRAFPGEGFDTQAADMAQEIRDQIVLGTWDPSAAGAQIYYVFGIIGTVGAYASTGLDPAGTLGTYKNTLLTFGYAADLGPQGTAYAIMALSGEFPGDAAVAAYIDGGLAYLATQVEANGDIVCSTCLAPIIIPEEMGEVVSGFAEAGGSIVPDAPAGECLSSIDNSVTVAIKLDRVPGALPEVRGYSVTFLLDPLLVLDGAIGTAITEGSFLSSIGGTHFERLANGGGSYTVDCAILGVPCGAAGGGTLFTVKVARAAGDGTGTITVTDVTIRDCDNHPIAGVPGPAESITIDTAGPAAITNLAAPQKKLGNDADGTTQIQINFTAPGDAAVTEVYRAPFGNYPEYDDAPGAGSTPATPSYPPGAPWALTGVTATGQYDEPSSRDFWHYVVFTKDACANVSAVSNKTGGTLNYHLGDVTPTSNPGDNDVEGLDISRLGTYYGVVLADPGPDARADLDVGPTTDHSPNTRPTTDNRVNFEDLIMFAMNFGTVSINNPAPGLDDVPGGTPDLALSAVPTPDGVLARVYLINNPGSVKGFHALVGYDRKDLDLVRVEEGDLLGAQGHPVFFRHLDEGAAGIHAAVLGQSTTIHGSGEVARLHFRGRGAVELTLADLRDLENRFMGDPPAPAISPEAAAPAAAFELLAARPNPFNPSTMIGFRLPEAGPVSLRVYDIRGRLIRTLVEGDLAAGEHMAFWDGRGARGHPASSGVYVVALRTREREATQKIHLTK